ALDQLAVLGFQGHFARELGPQGGRSTGQLAPEEAGQTGGDQRDQSCRNLDRAKLGRRPPRRYTRLSLDRGHGSWRRLGGGRSRRPSQEGSRQGEGGEAYLHGWWESRGGPKTSL